MALTYQISIENLFGAKDKDDRAMGTPYRFVVKSYQRGYRWEPIHINHLIEDLNTFKQSVNENGSTIKKKYCLQPIIVRELDKDKNEWELVDGQQRSVSLWLMRRVCFWFRDDPDEKDDTFYSFKFDNKEDLQKLVDIIIEKTRTRVSAFDFILEMKQKINEGMDNYIYEYFGIEKGKNIDVDCMMECLREILLFPKVKSVLDSIFLSADSNVPTKANSILLVWYQLENSDESGENDAITVFSNINANKIKLTESELIKAQILSNLRELQQKDEEEAKIALKWEETERVLCDDSFWYFLNAGDGKETGTRIDFLFEIWSKTEDNDLGSVNKAGLSDGWKKSDYPLSDLIENTFKNSNQKAETALAIWQKISSLLDTLIDWKNDYYFYHMIGLIIAVNKLAKTEETAADIIQRCYGKFRKVSSKEEFKYYLQGEVRKQMFSVGKCDSFADFVTALYKMNYEDNKDQIRILLLMYNIASLINARNDHERFPFELFFSDKYDIEHVNPQNPTEEKDEDKLKEWYKSMGIEYDSAKGVGQLMKEAQAYADLKHIHSIGNLVLLDENTNRAYKNKAFFEKRGEIINILRTGKRKNGNDLGIEKYIPIGTKWVFLKAFSDLEDEEAASIHSIWDGENDYKADIRKQLWLLQSGYKYSSQKHLYYEYNDEKNELELCGKGLIIDNDGNYIYLKSKEAENNGKKVVELVSVEGETVVICGEETNGLIPDGKYELSNGRCIPKEENVEEGEV